MRQIQLLTQLLKQVIFKKNQNKHQEAVQDIQNALKNVTREHPRNFDELDFSETLGLFIHGHTFESELALAVADLLVEQGEMLYQKSFSKAQHAWAQALLLYKKASTDKNASVPLDIDKSIYNLEKKLLANHLETINNILN